MDNMQDVSFFYIKFDIIGIIYFSKCNLVAYEESVYEEKDHPVFNIIRVFDRIKKNQKHIYILLSDFKVLYRGLIDV